MVLGRERDFAPGHGHTTTFIIPIILYRFQKDPFCVIILYDILFYFIHVYIAPGQEETPLVDILFMEAFGSGDLIIISKCSSSSSTYNDHDNSKKNYEWRQYRSSSCYTSCSSSRQNLIFYLEFYKRVKCNIIKRGCLMVE